MRGVRSLRVRRAVGCGRGRWPAGRVALICALLLSCGIGSAASEPTEPAPGLTAYNTWLALPRAADGIAWSLLVPATVAESSRRPGLLVVLLDRAVTNDEEGARTAIAALMAAPNGYVVMVAGIRQREQLLQGANRTGAAALADILRVIAEWKVDRRRVALAMSGLAGRVGGVVLRGLERANASVVHLSNWYSDPIVDAEVPRQYYSGSVSYWSDSGIELGALTLERVTSLLRTRNEDPVPDHVLRWEQHAAQMPDILDATLAGAHLRRADVLSRVFIDEGVLASPQLVALARAFNAKPTAATRERIAQFLEKGDDQQRQDAQVALGMLVEELAIRADLVRTMVASEPVFAAAALADLHRLVAQLAVQGTDLPAADTVTDRSPRARAVLVDLCDMLPKDPLVLDSYRRWRSAIGKAWGEDSLFARAIRSASSR